MRQLQETHPGLGESSLGHWEKDVSWQPLRRVIEELLVTYDWGEAFTALCLVVKPLVDAATVSSLAGAAQRAGDDALARILGSLDEDCRWHREWSDVLARLALERHGEAMTGWIRRWRPRTLEAIAAWGDFEPRLVDDAARALGDRLRGLGVTA